MPNLLVVHPNMVDIVFHYAPLGETHTPKEFTSDSLTLWLHIELLIAREIVIRPSDLKSNNGVSVKKEKSAVGNSSSQAGGSKKRTSDAAGIVELSSDESDGVSALDEEEKAAFARLKVIL